MARPPRLDFPGARHHVMNRGARREPVFVTDEACLQFLAVVADLPERFGARVHAFALMPNHFHLLLETPRGNLSRAMQYVTGEYVRRLNTVQSWDGPLFKGRFRNRLVETDDYWKDLLCYVHLNPLRAHLATRLEDTRWTSHPAYAGVSAPPPWLTTGPLLELFGGHEGYLAAAEDFRVGRKRFSDALDPERLWRPSTSRPAPARPPARPADPRAEIVRLASICRVELDAVTTPRRGRGDHRPRWVAAWWLVYGLGLTNRAAARVLAAEDTQVCRWITRVERLRSEPGAVREWVAELRASRDAAG